MDAKKEKPPVVKKEEFKRPPFTPIRDAIDGIKHLLFNPEGNKIVMPLLFFFESVLLKLIIKSVAYTEIDYVAYMEQIEMIVNENNMNYSEIRGGTGPLVYPAGHVVIYKIMSWITNGTENIALGQDIFRFLYLGTFLLQLVCYYNLRLSPWCVILACLSKRLHSIYVLRLFNDCFTTLFMVLTCLVLIRCSKKPLTSKKRTIFAFLTSLTYTIAISVKMNALLYFPAVIVSLYLLNEGQLFLTLCNLLVMILWQINVALPFLKEYPSEYLKGAFNFGRQFMFKWSINWQFLEEEGFHNKSFHLTLLASQFIAILTILLTSYPYLINSVLTSLRHPFKRTLAKSGTDNITQMSKVPYILITCNFIGVLFSRSLHYQFLSWYHWTIPILIFWSRLPIWLGVPWYIVHEYCWNSYPPNATASALLMTANGLLLLLVVGFSTLRPLDAQIHSRMPNNKGISSDEKKQQ